MIKDYYAFWSDNWSIDRDVAWFISGQEQAIYSYDMKKGKCKFISRIPDYKVEKWRLCSLCIKCDDEIFCIPDRGKYIWIYSLSNKEWSNIKINNLDKKRFCGVQIKKLKNSIYVYSIELKRIYIINIKEKKIDKYIDIPKNENEKLGFGIFENTSFYVISLTHYKLYEYNLKTDYIKTYNLPSINDELYTITKGKDFFVFCGKSKKIYVWYSSENKIEIYNKLPEYFGEYNFAGLYNRIINFEGNYSENRLFYSIFTVGHNIWFIPYQTNKILYMDILSKNLKEFFIEDENESEVTLKNRPSAHKYLLEYIKDNRFIGLYSLKNQHIIEIDSKYLTYRLLPFSLDSSIIKDFAGEIMYENLKVHISIYTNMLNNHNLNPNISDKIGKKIYQNLK